MQTVALALLYVKDSYAPAFHAAAFLSVRGNALERLDTSEIPAQ